MRSWATAGPISRRSGRDSRSARRRSRPVLDLPAPRAHLAGLRGHNRGNHGRRIHQFDRQAARCIPAQYARQAIADHRAWRRGGAASRRHCGKCRCSVLRRRARSWRRARDATSSPLETAVDQKCIARKTVSAMCCIVSGEQRPRAETAMLFLSGKPGSRARTPARSLRGTARHAA